MSGIKKISHIIIAILLASAAGVIAWYYIKINTPGVKVVVAKADRIAVGTVIGPDHVSLKGYPLSVVPKDAETSLQSVIGKTVVSGTIFQGEVIRKGHIAADLGSLKAALNLTAPGREAIDLPGETSTGLKGISIGDRVNVFTEIVTQYGKEPVTVVDCVAREAVIIKIPPAAAKDSPLASATHAVKGAYVVAVSPDEAKKVAEGIVRGKRFSISLLPEKGGR